MSQQHQYGLIPCVMQGGVTHETAAKYPALVCVNSVPHTADIHLPDPKIALRNTVQGHGQGGGSFYGLRIRYVANPGGGEPPPLRGYDV